jgi:uncharacterized membrane protein (UPF0127 family)
MLRDAERPHALHIVRSGLPSAIVEIVASHVELAVDSESRRRGLLGRDTLDEGAALIIAPCSSIHTFFMRFAIDVMFVARDGRVLKTYNAVGPRRIAFRFGAFAVVELPAGALIRPQTKAGDIVRLVSPRA